MPTYGRRPGDVVTDSRGNTLRDVTIKLYVSEAAAVAGGTAAATVVTDDRGRWEYVAAAGELWARTPDGSIWQVNDASSLDDYLNITEGDERYYTQAQVDAALGGKADDAHTHSPDDLTATGIRDSTTFLRGDNTYAEPPTGAGVADHGDLTGLGDDDHTQYAKADGSRGDFATVAQGILAASATQPGDLATVATTGAYADLTGAPTLGTAAAAATGDFAAASHTHVATAISDSTTTGRAVVTAASTAAARTAIEAVGSTTVTAIVSLSQASYDALGTPDSTTLYVIV